MMQRAFGSNRCVLFLVVIQIVCVRVCERERVSECVRERERERAKVHSFGVRDAQALSDEEISRTFFQEKSLKY